MRWLRFLFLLVLIPLAGCALAPQNYAVDTAGPYRLASGDVVRVTVYGDKDLTNTYKIDDSGAISFPLVGPVRVGGDTTASAAARLSAALANGFMRSPNVVVEVAEYRPFFIQGEVTNSGQFAYIYGMTARDAVSTAGGFKDTADRGSVMVFRPHGGEMARLHVALDFPIQPGDTVVIGERWF
jgi:polysaccharide export outer membrane protein